MFCLYLLFYLHSSSEVFFHVFVDGRLHVSVEKDLRRLRSRLVGTIERMSCDVILRAWLWTSKGLAHHQTCAGGKTHGIKGSKEHGTQVKTCAGLPSHLYFWEYLVKEFETVLVVKGSQLVKRLLVYLMGYGVAVNNCSKDILSFDFMPGLK